MGKIKNVTGQKFHRLTAIKFLEIKGRSASWLFKCDCGNEKAYLLLNVAHGTTKSCGCLNMEQRKSGNNRRKHNMSKSRLYKMYHMMIQRCTNTNNKNYPQYGGRGIRVCQEWLESFESFRNWAFSNGYQDGLSIDRENNERGNYEPSNCRWVTSEVQGENKRTSILLEYQGETHCLSHWANKFGIKPHTIIHRYNNMGLRPPELFDTNRARK